MRNRLKREPLTVWVTGLLLASLLFVAGIAFGWLVLDTRLSALEERIDANRSAELHLEQSQDIVAITNDLSERVRRVEER